MATYVPAENRQLTHPTTDWDTLAHLLKGCLGSGILAMPLAFSNAGLGWGLIAIVIVAYLCTYGAHILIKSAQTLCVRQRIPALGYGETAEAAFSQGPESLRPWAGCAKGTIDLFIIADLMGTCCVYVVFVAKNVKQVVDRYKGVDINLRLYMVMVLPFLLLMNLIRNLKYLAPFSVIANLLIGIGMGITFYFIVDDLPSPSDSDAVWVQDVSRWPMFFGTTIFALEAIAVVMSLENNMVTPTHFIGCPGVLNIGMFVVSALYTVIGFFGYLKFGSETEGSISLNLDQENNVAQAVKVMIAVAIYLTYALQFYVPMEIIWKKILQSWTEPNIVGEFAVRWTIVVITVLVAIAVPNLGGFISLVGAFCLSALGLIFPAIIDFVTFHEDPGLGCCYWRIWIDGFLIIFGLLGLFSGTYVSILEIIDSYS